MRRLYPPYGIEPEPPEPTLWEALQMVISCPAFQVFALFVAAVTLFLLGFVTGSRCEATRAAMIGPLF
jgi:hypothetical protein